MKEFVGTFTCPHCDVEFAATEDDQYVDDVTDECESACQWAAENDMVNTLRSHDWHRAAEELETLLKDDA